MHPKYIAVYHRTKCNPNEFPLQKCPMKIDFQNSYYNFLVSKNFNKYKKKC